MPAGVPGGDIEPREVVGPAHHEGVLPEAEHFEGAKHDIFPCESAGALVEGDDAFRVAGQEDDIIAGDDGAAADTPTIVVAAVFAAAVFILVSPFDATVAHVGAGDVPDV